MLQLRRQHMKSDPQNRKWKYTRTEPKLAYRHVHLHVDRPHVLVVHGGPGDNSAYLMASIGPELEKRYNVLWYDQRGCGNSPRNLEPDCYSPFDNVIDVANLLDELKIQHVVMIGHSWGGMLAGMFAAEYPEKTMGLISVCSCGSFPDLQNNLIKRLSMLAAGESNGGGTLRNIEMMSSDFMKLIYLLGRARQAGLYYKNYEHTKKELEHLNALAVKQGYYSSGTIKDAEDVLLHCCDRHALYTFEIYSYLNRIKSPALIMGGKYDGVVDLSCVHKYAKAIPSSRLCIFDHSGHNPFQEEPARFMEIVGTFIESLS